MNLSLGVLAVELVKALKAFNQNIQARLGPYVAIKHASSSTKMALIAMKLEAFALLFAYPTPSAPRIHFLFCFYMCKCEGNKILSFTQKQLFLLFAIS